MAQDWRIPKVLQDASLRLPRLPMVSSRGSRGSIPDVRYVESKPASGIDKTEIDGDCALRPSRAIGVLAPESSLPRSGGLYLTEPEL